MTSSSKSLSLVEKSKGISLVEMLVIIAILGILTAISIANIGKGQIATANLENIRSWYEMVRRSSLRGEACTISIYTTGLKDGSTILSSAQTSGTSSIASTPCGAPSSLQLESPYGKERYALSVKSGSSNINEIIITPRGTIMPGGTSGSVFSDDIVFTLALANASYQEISLKYCMRLSSFLGSVIGIGSGAC